MRGLLRCCGVASVALAVGCSSSSDVRPAPAAEVKIGIDAYYAGQEKTQRELNDPMGFRVRTTIDEASLDQVEDYVWCYSYERERTVLVGDAGWEPWASGRECMWVDDPGDGSGEFEGLRVEMLTDAQVAHLEKEGKWPSDVQR